MISRKRAVRFKRFPETLERFSAKDFLKSCHVPRQPLRDSVKRIVQECKGLEFDGTTFGAEFLKLELELAREHRRIFPSDIFKATHEALRALANLRGENPNAFLHTAISQKHLLEIVFSRPESREVFFKALMEHNPSQYTELGRYAKADSWLKENFLFKSFCDIGCAAQATIPMSTTIESKNVFGKKANVVGIDIVEPPKEFSPFQRGVKFLKHQIANAPLPQRFDVIRFQNVAYYLPPKSRRRAFRHIFESLNDYGLFIFGRKIYQKRGKELFLVKEF